MSDQRRVYFLDGLRGWAALIVLTQHSMLDFLHAQVYHLPVFRFVTDGTMAVYVFFIVSGFALSIRHADLSNAIMFISATLRRYVRLAVPIFCSSAIAFSFMKMGLFYSLQAAQVLQRRGLLQHIFQFHPTLSNFLSFTLFEAYFNYDDDFSYNSVLWSMPFEFYGSLLIFSIFLIINILKGRGWFLIYFICFLLFYILNIKMVPFIVGMALAKLYRMKIIQDFRQTPYSIGVALLCLGVAVYISTFAHVYPRDPKWLTVRAFFIVMAPILSKRIAGFFEYPFSMFLGRISYPLYLTHVLVICSFGSYVLVSLYPQGHLTIIESNTIFAMTFLMSIIIALLFEPIERIAISLAHTISARSTIINPLCCKINPKP